MTERSCGFESHYPHHKRNPKNKECGAAVTDPVRWPPRLRVVDGSRQMRISCNPLIFRMRGGKYIHGPVEKGFSNESAGANPVAYSNIAVGV